MVVKKKIPTNVKRKLRDGEIEYKKMMREVQPFIKKRKVSDCSTAGKWNVLSYNL